MKEINHSELKSVVKTFYDKKLSLFVWGTFGIGKSTIIKEVADELKINCIDVRISQLEPSDLRGIPKVDGIVTRWLPPSWLPSDKDSKGILFFDEINLAPPSIQASCYQLILDRRLGDYVLPNGWVVVSCGNRIEDRANVFELPSPLANRFCHIGLRVPTIDEWTDWGLNNGTQIDSRIIAFLQFKPSRIFAYDSKNKDKAIGTPRSWEFCSKLIKDVSDLDVLETLVSSAVGEAVAIEFIAFIKLQRKIDVEDLIKNPEKVKEIKEIDLKYSLLPTITEYFNKHKKADVLKSIVLICNNMEAEFSVLLLRLIKSSDKTFFLKEAIQIKEFKELARLSSKYLL